VTRDELEAAIWKRWPTRDPIAIEAIDAILTCADSYARHVDGIAAERRAVLGQSPRKTRDDTRAHQIRLTFHRRDRIAVSCTCRAISHTRNDYKPIEVRTRWDAAEAQAVWHAHLVAVGQALHTDAAS
jgi:hypothetical protein